MIATWGRLDVLVNDAGVIVSAPFIETNDDDFRDLLDVHLWGTLHMSSRGAAASHRPTGRAIVNIASMPKLPVPHLSAYCTSKFAQAGLSSVMAEELRGTGVRVVTVYPGLMRTGSHVNARFKGDLRVEFALFATAASLPGISMGAERAARTIIRAVERGKRRGGAALVIRQVARGPLRSGRGRPSRPQHRQPAAAAGRRPARRPVPGQRPRHRSRPAD